MPKATRSYFVPTIGCESQIHTQVLGAIRYRQIGQVAKVLEQQCHVQMRWQLPYLQTEYVVAHSDEQLPQLFLVVIGL